MNTNRPIVNIDEHEADWIRQVRNGPVPIADTVINEDEVVRRAADQLRSDGWEIVSTCTSLQRGLDIDAASGGARLIGEAKGSIRVKPGGKPFTNLMCRQSIEAALFKMASAMSSEDATNWLIAVPNTDGYRKALTKVEFFLNSNSIRVMLVGDTIITDLHGAAWDR